VDDGPAAVGGLERQPRGSVVQALEPLRRVPQPGAGVPVQAEVGRESRAIVADLLVEVSTLD
jgi:hypothetical protein